MRPDHPLRRWPRLTQRVAVGVVAATGVAFALPLGDDATFAASTLGTLGAGLLMVASLAWAVRVNEGLDRLPWIVTLLVYGMGLAVFAVDPVAPESAGGDYSAAMFFGPIAIAGQIGIVVILAKRVLAASRTSVALLDTLWLSGAAVVLSWNVVGRLVVDDPDLVIAEKMLLLATVGLFALLVGLLIVLVSLTERAARPLLLILASPAVLLALALAGQARAISNGGLGPGTFADFLFPLAFGIGAAAVLESRASDRIRPGNDARDSESMTVASLPLLAWVAMVALGALSVTPDSPLLGLGVGAVALIRIGKLVRENRRLISDLQVRVTHDHLTGLPNRARLEELITTYRDGPAAVLLVDLDRFKTINDTLGHRAGDQLLSEASRRMERVISDGWTVVRLAGDEFVIVGVDDGCGDLIELGRRVIDVLCTSFLVGDREVWVSATIGIATTGAGLHPTELVDAADGVLRRAKATRRGEVLMVEPGSVREAAGRDEVESALRDGIDRGELFCLYQPKVDLASGGLVGLEALVRWNRPGHGVVAPDRFIGVAEASGLITKVDEWVFAEAIDQLARWNRLDPTRRLSLSVNMSAWQLSRFDVHDSVARVIGANGGVDPAQITIELTESALIEAPSVVSRRLERLRDVGVRLSIDDFGVGFTAIAYLVDFPVDEVKIDRSLVDQLTGGPADDRSLAAAVLALASAIDLDIIAEGVETAAQAASLRRLGCERAQGFLFSKPLPVDAVDSLIRDRVSFDTFSPHTPRAHAGTGGSIP